MSARLSVSGLGLRFGGLLALDEISFSVENQEIFSIIGPNGAGKTSLFNCISAYYQPDHGQVRLADRLITGWSTHRLARHGLLRTFQHIRLFPHLSVLDNLLVAQHRQVNANPLAGLLNLPSYRRAEQAAVARAYTWLDEFGLRAYANQPAASLPYGCQRRLDIARCMLAQARVLLLDEPAAGLNPQEKLELQQFILRLRDQHELTILLIEHDMSLVMGISDRVLVMEHGKTIMTGTPAQVRSDARVIKAYLGEA